MDLIRQTETNMEDWYKVHLYRLIEVAKRAASKYTRSKVRKALPPNFAYVIEELITEKAEVHDKESYYNEIYFNDYTDRKSRRFLSRQFQS